MPKSNKQVRKLNVCKPPAGLTFSAAVVTYRSSYRDKLNEALCSEAVIQIIAADKYALHQFKINAKKLNIRLAFALQAEYLYIKPMNLSGDEMRLLLLLREPRTVLQLRQVKPALEVNIEFMLDKWKKEEIAIYKAATGAYNLTSKGWDLLPHDNRSDRASA